MQEKNKSSQDSISKKVERETSLKLPSVQLLSTKIEEEIEKCFYHAPLTDADVNNIQRGEGQTVSFFTLQEVEKLSLTESSRAFLTMHKDFLEKMPN